MASFKVVFFVLTFFGFLEGKNILISTISDYGHLYPLLNLGKALQNNGHNITVASPKESERHVKHFGLHYMKVGVSPPHAQFGKDGDFSFSKMKQVFESSFTPSTLSAYSDLIDLLPNNTDAMICDDLSFGCILAAHDLQIPLIINQPGIYYSDDDPSYYHPMLGGNPKHVALSKKIYAISFKLLVDIFIRLPFAMQLTSARYNQNSPRWHLTISDLNDFGLKLVNSAIGFEYARDLPPNVIFTGPLIDHRSSISVSGDNKGLILISFGTVFTPSHELLMKIMGSLEDLHNTQNFSVIMATKANFTHTVNWLSVVDWVDQIQLLRRPDIKFFISHGGNSVIQSLYFGVPVLTIPLGADQNDFAYRLSEIEAGIYLTVNHSSNSFTEAMKNLIEQPKYKENAIKIAKILQQGGCSKAVDYIEAFLHWPKNIFQESAENSVFWAIFSLLMLFGACLIRYKY